MNKCKHKYGNRRRIGPDSDKIPMILIEQCSICGKLKPIEQISYKQADWIIRYNRYMDKVRGL
jgi:hypothetical protein